MFGAGFLLMNKLILFFSVAIIMLLLGLKTTQSKLTTSNIKSSISSRPKEPSNPTTITRNKNTQASFR
jgi:hypothetical protein